jgi:hypothetical protein
MYIIWYYKKTRDMPAISKKAITSSSSFYNSSTTQNGPWLAQQFPSIAPSFIHTSPKSWTSWFEGHPLVLDDNGFQRVIFFVVFSSCIIFRCPNHASLRAFIYLTIFLYFKRIFISSFVLLLLSFYIPYNIPLFQKNVYFFVLFYFFSDHMGQQ